MMDYSTYGGETVPERENLDQELHRLLKKHWGYDSFRPLQFDICRSILSGHDTIGLLPTGGGKSLTFQVPALTLQGLTVVVTPLISLMKDQVDGLKKRHIAAAYLSNGMTRSETQLTFERLRQGRVRILYLAPERLAREGFAAMMKAWNVCMIVVDEAHCISQWGYDFRPSYLKLEILREAFPEVPVLALTASATPEVVADIARRLVMRQPRIFRKSFARPNISFVVRYAPEKYSKLVSALNNTTGSAIVYVRSRKRAVEIAKMLAESGISAAFYHAGLDIQEKNMRQDAWQSGKTRVMVATTAFGMGIDKPDVRLVVHVDLPSTLEEYYQEAGRAGRDGRPSFALVIASPHDKGIFARRLGEAFPPKEFINKVYDETCRFLDLTVGENFGNIYDFNPEVMCERYKVPLKPTLGALSILSRAGYFEYIEETDSYSRLHFTVERTELYDVDLEEWQENIMQAILRMYPGLFADYIYIDEVAVANRAGCRPDDVYQTLVSLNRQHVLSYIPRKRTPHLYMSMNRRAPSSISLPAEVYDARRQAMEKRLAAMKNFVFGTARCRVQAMLEYFGQADASPCGQCDVCRAAVKPPKPFDAEDFDRKLMHFFQYISPETRLNLPSVLKHFEPHAHQAAGRLRQLAAEGYIKIEGNTATLLQPILKSITQNFRNSKKI